MAETEGLGTDVGDIEVLALLPAESRVKANRWEAAPARLVATSYKTTSPSPDGGRGHLKG